VTLQDWGLVGTTIVAIATAAWTGVKTLSDRRVGVRGTEAAERRDTVADRDALIDQMQEEISTLRSRLDRVEAQLTIEQDYSRQLVDQIYRGEGPPPRPRPTTA